MNPVTVLLVEYLTASNSDRDPRESHVESVTSRSVAAVLNALDVVDATLHDPRRVSALHSTTNPCSLTNTGL